MRTNQAQLKSVERRPLRSRIARAFRTAALLTACTAVGFGACTALGFPPPGSDRTVRMLWPYTSKVKTKNKKLKKLATHIAEGCPSKDKNCRVNRIYRFVVDNHKYIWDPDNGKTNIIQSPFETMKRKGGDCEDLAILLNSLLENIGIRTYLILAKDHMYSFACGIDLKGMRRYIRKSLAKRGLEGFAKRWEVPFVSEGSESYLVHRIKRVVVIKPLSELRGIYVPLPSHKYGSIAVKIKYSISSLHPVSAVLVGKSKTKITRKKRKISGNGRMTKAGDLFMYNENKQPIKVAYDVRIYYQREELPEINEFWYDIVDGKKCVVLDPAAGKSSYPGLVSVTKGKNIAIDPITRRYFRLSY